MEERANPPPFAPPRDGPREGKQKSLTVAPGVLLVQTHGTSMWPALLTGDLIFGHPFRAGENAAPGTVLVVEGPHGLMAHRLQRTTGRPGKRRFLLAGDLRDPDFPFREEQVRGVAEVIYRKNSGFLDIPPSPGLGPIGRRLVTGLARLWEWLEAHRASPLLGESGESDGRLLQ